MVVVYTDELFALDITFYSILVYLKSHKRKSISKMTRIFVFYILLEKLQ